MLTDESLFPRHLFIRLSQDGSAPSWGLIRSTKDVSRLVCFGGSSGGRKPSGSPAGIRSDDSGSARTSVQAGRRVRLTEPPFAGIEGIYHMVDGERRVMVLIELISKQVRVWVTPAHLCKVG